MGCDKMRRLPKFIIGTNPMIDSNMVYILHTQKPRFVAVVEYGCIEVIEDIDDMYSYYNQNEEKVSGLLKRTKEWYKAVKINAKNDR